MLDASKSVDDLHAEIKTIALGTVDERTTVRATTLQVKDPLKVSKKKKAGAAPTQERAEVLNRATNSQSVAKHRGD